MTKLTTTQEEVLNEIKDYIAFAKKFDNVKNYYIAGKCRYCKGRPDYEKIYQYEKELFEEDEERITNAYKKYWEMGLKNIALTHCSSSTLRVLERKGYIKILKDSVNDVYGIDYVELIEG